MRTEQKRLLFVFISFSLVFLLILSKAFYIQVINKKHLIKYSEDQTLRTSKVYPYRGQIFDRSGHPLAVNIQTYTIFAIPKQIENLKTTVKDLSQLVPSIHFKKTLNSLKKRSRYTFLARKIQLTKQQVLGIKAMDGIYLESEPKRVYPNQETLSQVLGFVGIDNKGLSGLEYLYDEELRGKPRIIKYLKDAKGRAIKFESGHVEGLVKELTLSIDRDLQEISEKYLKDAVIKHKALSGGIGVLDANSGEVLAMANYPTYNPNAISKSAAKYRKLSFVTDPIEPGSIFKTFTVASALEHQIAKPTTNYYCERGRLEINGHIINEAESKKGHEWLSLKDILKYSSNIGTTKVAFELTYPKLRKTLKLFRIGDKTQIEIPGESRGIFPDDENVSPLSLSNISFGQGVATTGIQILAAYAPFANGGYYITPTIFKRDPNEELEREQILAPETVTATQEMLLSVVDSGTGTRASIPHYQIAGKTSTAQRPSADGGYHGYVSGFVGFPVKVDRPFVIYVYVDNPTTGGYYGDIVASPVFRKVAQYLLYRDKVTPTHVKTTAGSKNGHSVDRIVIKRKGRQLTKGIIPNFVGLDKKSADRVARKLEMQVIHKGIGIIQTQSPQSGTRYKKDESIILRYKVPTYD